MRAVLDVNVLVSGLFARDGAPAVLLRRWRDGAFDLVMTPRLLDELARVLTYPRTRSRVRDDRAGRLLDRIRSAATTADLPAGPPVVASRDPNDDYLIALARNTRSILVTGDMDLLALADRIPVMSPRAFLDSLDRAI